MCQAVLIAAACLLTACAKDEVVVVPVSLPNVSPDLMAPLRPAKCALPTGGETISSDQIRASQACWQAAYGAAGARLSGLQSAVRVREKAMAEAVAAATVKP